MSKAPVIFDGVWKKFRRGERLNTLRDSAIAYLKHPFAKGVPQTDLGDKEFWVLRDVSFEVRPGEALGIIGPNGAGKSTSLKLLTKILKPTLGHSEVSGRVGALIEVAAGFHPDLTGRENIYLQGAIHGMTRREITSKIDAIVDFSGSAEFLDTPVKRYSSGMNARLGFSVATQVNPDVLVIDEVLAVGDYQFQQKCYQRLKDFRSAGAAIVFVSHNMQAITDLCDRALLLRPKHPPMLDAVGKVAAIYAASDKEFADERVTVHEFRVYARDGQRSLPGLVAPGTWLTLDMDIEARVELPRCNIFFGVARTDGLKMFNHSPMLEGQQPLHLEPGSRLRSRIHFRANVLNGTFAIVVQIADAERSWAPIVLEGMASFVIHDLTRDAGCAELEPSYEFRVDQPHVEHVSID